MVSIAFGSNQNSWFFLLNETLNSISFVTNIVGKKNYGEAVLYIANVWKELHILYAPFLPQWRKWRPHKTPLAGSSTD